MIRANLETSAVLRSPRRSSVCASGQAPMLSWSPETGQLNVIRPLFQCNLCPSCCGTRQAISQLNQTAVRQLPSAQMYLHTHLAAQIYRLSRPTRFTLTSLSLILISNPFCLPLPYFPSQLLPRLQLRCKLDSWEVLSVGACNELSALCRGFCFVWLLEVFIIGHDALVRYYWEDGQFGTVSCELKQ